MRVWAKVSNDRMNVNIRKQLGVYLSPRFMNMAVYLNYQVSVSETDSQTSSPVLLGVDRYVCTGSGITESQRWV